MSNVVANSARHRSKAGKYCVAGGPNNISYKNSQHTEGVSIHRFQNAKKEPQRHAKWVKFIRKHRLGWKPSYTSVLCRSHFEDSCFKRNRTIAASLGTNATLKHNAIPTLDNANEIQQQVETPLSSCQRRKVLYRIFAVLFILSIYKHAIHSSTLYLYTPCNSTCATLTL